MSVRNGMRAVHPGEVCGGQRFDSALSLHFIIILINRIQLLSINNFKLNVVFFIKKNTYATLKKTNT